MSRDERTLYPSFEGLNRTAMVWGIPMLPGMLVVGVSLVAGLIAGVVLGPGGLLLALAGVPVLMFFKFQCVTDDQALRIMGFEFMCWVMRFRCRLFGKGLTLSPMRYGRGKKQLIRSFQATDDRALFEAFVLKLMQEDLMEKQCVQEHETQQEA